MVRERTLKEENMRLRKILKFYRIIMTIYIICLFTISIISIRDKYVYEGVKQEFGEYMLYQVELFNFCVEKGNLSFQDTLDDFVRYKTEQIINESKLNSSSYEELQTKW